MDIFLIGEEAKIFRCSNPDKEDEIFDMISELSWDRTLEINDRDDFDFVIIDSEGDVSEKFIGKRKKFIEEREDLFSSLLTHDLKNKVRLIKGSLQILKCECDLPDRAEERLVKTEKMIDNCVELIENISAYREIGKEEPKPIDIQVYLEEVLDTMEGILADKGFDLTVDFQESCPVIGGPLIKDIYSNMIENAVKHSGGNKIMISCERRKEWFVISIEDDGEGIAEGVEGRIFDKGFTTEEESGTGLGLYLVEEVMDLYGGKVELKRSELGGARFDLFFECA